MLATLKQRLERAVPIDKTDSSYDSEQTTRLAATALLIEAAQADNELNATELEHIKSTLVNVLGVKTAQVDEVLSIAQSNLEAATCLHEITSTVNRNWTLDEKILLIEALWQVVLSDEILDPHEQHLMRKIQALLYIPQSAYIAAKMRVRQALATK